MKPFAIVSYPTNPWSGRMIAACDGQTGRHYVHPKIDCVNTGDIQAEQVIYFFDDEPTMDSFLNELMRVAPYNTYMKMKTDRVYSRAPGAITVGQFTSKGFMPV